MKGDVRRPVKISGAPPVCGRSPIGTIIVQVVIDKRGSLTHPRLLRPKSSRAHDTDCILETLRTWKFQPATKNGVPVAVRYTLTLNIDRQ